MKTIIHHLVHFVHHMCYCIIGCTVYHMFDAYFGITRQLFELLGIGFK